MDIGTGRTALSPIDSSPLAAWIRAFFTTVLNDSARSVVVTICLALLGVAMLVATYSMIRTDWPETYTDTETRAQEHLRLNPIRTYFFFRGGPVFLVSVFVSVVMDRAGGWAWLGFWLMLVVYLVWTTGRAVFHVIRHPRHQNWLMLMAYHALSSITVVIAGVLAVALRSLFSPIIPNSRELLIAVWAGVFAALLGVLARHMLAPVRLEGQEVVIALAQDIGPKAWAYMCEQTEGREKLQNLVMAAILAESQQRPRWFRRLERLGGKFAGRGTYGVAQVAANKPISDNESIDLLIERLDTWWVHQALAEGDYSDEFGEVCHSLNDDAAHAGRIRSFYQTVGDMRRAGTLDGMFARPGK